MFMNLDEALARQRNEELMREARKWDLQRRLRANREQRPGTYQRVDRRRTGTGVRKELVRQYIVLRRTKMKEIDSRAFRGFVWLGKAALFCLGLLATLALLVVMTVLTAVMLAATAFPAPAVRRRGDLRDRRDGGNAPQFSAPRKAVAS